MVNYRTYIVSRKWKKKAAGARKRANYKCELCGSTGPLEVHHLTYKRLGYERAEDLQALCPPCHRGVHNLSADEGNGRWKWSGSMFIDLLERVDIAKSYDLSNNSTLHGGTMQNWWMWILNQMKTNSRTWAIFSRDEADKAGLRSVGNLKSILMSMQTQKLIWVVNELEGFENKRGLYLVALQEIWHGGSWVTNNFKPYIPGDWIMQEAEAEDEPLNIKRLKAEIKAEILPELHKHIDEYLGGRSPM